MVKAIGELIVGTDRLTGACCIALHKPDRLLVKNRDLRVAWGIELGSGNVFADLGLPGPDERQLRVQLAMRLNDLLQGEGITQAAVAKRLGIAQPRVSDLKNYKPGRFSSERLLHFITLLDRDVEVFTRPRA